MTASTGKPLTLHWFLPTSGDSRSLVGAGQGVPGRPAGGLRETLAEGFRPPTIDYLADVARTAERAGFDRGPDADRHLLRGRVAHHGRPAAGDVDG